MADTEEKKPEGGVEVEKPAAEKVPEDEEQQEAAKKEGEGREQQAAAAPGGEEAPKKAQGPTKAEVDEARRAELAEARKRREEDMAKKKAEEEVARAAEAERRRAELEELRKEAGEVYSVEDGAVKDLSEGFVGLTRPVFDEVSAHLAELQEAQIKLVELLAQEDRKVMTLPNMAEVAQALSHVPLYTQRLLEMRQEMDAITNRVKGMRKRAARVYTKKQQEDNTAAQQRHASLEEERQKLGAKGPA